MKKLRSICAMILSLGFVSAAHAELGVGVFGSYQLSGNYSVAGAGIDSVKSKGGSTFGALLFFPVLPWFSVRGGVAYENTKFETNVTGGGSSDTTLNNMLIPIDLQFHFPVVGLYAFAGAVFVSNQSTSPDTTGKAGSDTRTNLGIGYDFFSFTLLTLSGEVEYQKGSKNISPVSGYEMKTDSTNLTLMARFTL
jgi:outer membrane protein with beta-barrel domain